MDQLNYKSKFYIPFCRKFQAHGNVKVSLCPQPVKLIKKQCIFDYMALQVECQFNKNSLLLVTFCRVFAGGVWSYTIVLLFDLSGRVS